MRTASSVFGDHFELVQLLAIQTAKECVAKSFLHAAVNQLKLFLQETPPQYRSSIIRINY